MDQERTTRGAGVNSDEGITPLNRFLCDLHGPTTNIARTMSRLVPFPEQMTSLPDADLLDFSVAVDAASTEVGQSAHAHVRAVARYATSARACQIDEFYRAQFARSGLRVRERVGTENDHRLSITTRLQAETTTTCRITVDELRGYRSVRLSVRYGDYDHGTLFARFADWHNGDAPVSSASKPTGLEISTFASGRRPNTLVLYSTHYECSQTSRRARREMVDDWLDERGWSYREPREGIMFMKDGSFDAETHVLGDEHSSNVTFVGEFQLR